jgi:hypothetical protein
MASKNPYRDKWPEPTCTILAIAVEAHHLIFPQGTSGFTLLRQTVAK